MATMMRFTKVSNIEGMRIEREVELIPLGSGRRVCDYTQTHRVNGEVVATSTVAASEAWSAYAWHRAEAWTCEV